MPSVTTKLIGYPRLLGMRCRLKLRGRPTRDYYVGIAHEERKVLVIFRNKGKLSSRSGLHRLDREHSIALASSPGGKPFFVCCVRHLTLALRRSQNHET